MFKTKNKSMEQILIDKFQQSNPIININGMLYCINLIEFESFLQQCGLFMSIEDNGLETMTKIISDQIIDGENTTTSVNELKTQLRFLRELSFLMKNMIMPVSESDND